MCRDCDEPCDSQWKLWNHYILCPKSIIDCTSCNVKILRGTHHTCSEICPFCNTVVKSSLFILHLSRHAKTLSLEDYEYLNKVIKHKTELNILHKKIQNNQKIKNMLLNYKYEKQSIYSETQRTKMLFDDIVKLKKRIDNTSYTSYESRTIDDDNSSYTSYDSRTIDDDNSSVDVPREPREPREEGEIPEDY